MLIYLAPIFECHPMILEIKLHTVLTLIIRIIIKIIIDPIVFGNLKSEKNVFKKQRINQYKNCFVYCSNVHAF